MRVSNLDFLIGFKISDHIIVLVFFSPQALVIEDPFRLFLSMQILGPIFEEHPSALASEKDILPFNCRFWDVRPVVKEAGLSLSCMLHSTPPSGRQQLLQ